MYTKDKSQRITLRLNEDQFGFVRMNADTLGVSPSDFLRMVINSSMVMWKQASQNEEFKDGIKSTVEASASEVKDIFERNGEGRENDKTNLDNIV